MNLINKLLSTLNLRLARIPKKNQLPEKFLERYNTQLNELKKDNRGFQIFDTVEYEGGNHPQSYVDAECGFASYHLEKINTESILDIGTYRRYLLGLLSHYKITTVDVRERTPYLKNENCVTGNATKLSFEDNKFDVVLSLCSFANFGMGRYGDDFDMDADKKAVDEMIRVLKPGGHLIFSTTITAAKPFMLFNSHKVYTEKMIRDFCKGMVPVEEKYFSQKLGRFCTAGEITNNPPAWDNYCGCWKKM